MVNATTGTEEEKCVLRAILSQTDKRGEPRVIYYASRALSISEKITLLSHWKCKRHVGAWITLVIS
jgi:hypothetical protein